MLHVVIQAESGRQVHVETEAGRLERRQRQRFIQRQEAGIPYPGDRRRDHRRDQGRGSPGVNANYQYSPRLRCLSVEIPRAYLQ